MFGVWGFGIVEEAECPIVPYPNRPLEDLIFSLVLGSWEDPFEKGLKGYKPKPRTLNPEPQTPNPKPQTPNPKPQTLNPKP